jgi:dihydropteroate synthase
MVSIIGIVNLSPDSFFAGGRFPEPAAAIVYARKLVAEGAELIDVGAESTNPKGADVPAETELARLTPVVHALKADGISVSVDTHKPEVMARAAALGADVINDVTGFRDPRAVAAVRDFPATRLIVMYSRAPGARAGGAEATADADPARIVAEILAFFNQRIAALESAGIARARLILDPGMGFFLSTNPAVSLAVLCGLDRIVALGLPVCVGTSQKGFIGAVLAGAGQPPRPPDERAAGTLATELWAALRGVAYVRTHAVRALRDMLVMYGRLAGEDLWRQSVAPQRC